MIRIFFFNQNFLGSDIEAGKSYPIVAWRPWYTRTNNIFFFKLQYLLSILIILWYFYFKGIENKFPF